MSVRPRKWTHNGVERSAWVVDYHDAAGKRRHKTFEKKKDATAFSARASVEVKEGTHVADRDTITVAKAGKLWISAAVSAGLERTTVKQYQEHLDLHIVPTIGGMLLSKTTPPVIRSMEDTLREMGRSPAMIKKVRGSVGALFSDALDRGLCNRNPVRDVAKTRRRGKERQKEKRQKGKLQVGVDIPAPDEIKAFVAALSGRWRPLLLTLVFSGLRASELRGLRWSDVDVAKKRITVTQRADAFNDIGAPKSEAGSRSIPIPPILANALKEWKLACPKGDLGLVFPNGAGNVESHANIVNRGLVPAMIAAGITTQIGKDKDGQPILAAKYTGLHALRHFYASWCINAKSVGGLELRPKAVQERLGHSSITMTMDTYGHLFPDDDTGDELASAATALLT
jgi:integrase